MADIKIQTVVSILPTLSLEHDNGKEIRTLKIFKLFTLMIFII